MERNLFELIMGDIMTKEVITVAQTETVREAVKKMKDKKIGAVIVMGQDNRMNGIFSERDLIMRVIAEGMDPAKTLVSEVMTKDPQSLSSDISVFDAFELTHNKKFRHIPVVNDGNLVGIVSARDINKAFYDGKDALNEMKMKFAMVASHELKTPNAIIVGCVDLMKRHAKELSDKQKNALDIIDRNVTRLNELVNNLARLYAGALPSTKVNLEPSFIKDIIHVAVFDVTPVLKKRNQNIKLEVGEDIPQIFLDRKNIKQVLLNILLNSVRFTADSGTIVIRAINEKDNIRVEIEDNGIGIPKNKLKTIFESFYETSDIMKHSSGSIEFQSGGLGLGLAIAKNIIDSHKGKIWAESEEGKSSKIIFTLPKM